jgi:broad specificity phosphatase PhoE
MTERRFLFVRHPQTEANVTGRWVGRGDSAYTELGETQRDAVVREIVAWRPALVVSSPLERARIPAALAAGALRAPHRIDARLSELDFGAAEGMTLDEAEAAGIPFEFMAEDHPVAPGGESRRDALLRTAAVCDELASGDHDRVAIVTHGGVFRSAMVHLLALPPLAIWAFHIDNAQLAEVIVRDGHGMLEEFRVAR